MIPYREALFSSFVIVRPLRFPERFFGEGNPLAKWDGVARGFRFSSHVPLELEAVWGGDIRVVALEEFPSGYRQNDDGEDDDDRG